MANNAAHDAVAEFDKMLVEETGRRNPALHVSFAAAASGLMVGSFSESTSTGSQAVANAIVNGPSNGRS